MGFLGDWFRKNNKPVGVSRPLQMQFRFAATGEVMWSVVNSDNFIENGYLGNHAIFSIQDWKSQQCAQAEPIVYQKRDEKTYKKYKSLLKDATRDSFLRARDIKTKALEEISEHEMQKVLDFPNPLMSRSEMDYGLSAYLDLTGNSYLFGVRDGMDGVTGKIKEMYLPPAQQVKSIMTGYEVSEYYLNSSPDKKINAANVCHIRNWNPQARTEGETYQGLSRLHALSHSIDSYNESISTEAGIYQDKGVRNLVFPKGQFDSNEVSLEGYSSQRDRFNQQLRETGQGGIITSSIEMGSIALGFSPKDLGILESKALTKVDFCAAYHIPPEIFGWGQNAKYSNMDVFIRIALTDAILPEYEKKANMLNQWLTKSYDETGKDGLVIGYNYDVFNVLNPDKKEMVEWMKGVPLTANEIREAFGYGIIEGENNNKLLVANNFKLLDDLGIESFDGGVSDLENDL